MDKKELPSRRIGLKALWPWGFSSFIISKKLKWCCGWNIIGKGGRRQGWGGAEITRSLIDPQCEAQAQFTVEESMNGFSGEWKICSGLLQKGHLATVWGGEWKCRKWWQFRLGRWQETHGEVQNKSRSTQDKALDDLLVRSGMRRNLRDPQTCGFST